jgi:hypothetical protein
MGSNHDTGGTMFGLDILEVAIGLSFVYRLLSMMCSAIVEAIELLIRQRKRLLRRGIQALLDTATQEFVKHPLIKALDKDADGKTSAPSYIPGHTFVAAVLDISLGNTSGANAPHSIDTRDLIAMRDKLAENYSSPLNRALIALFDRAEGDVEKAKKFIEQWFDDSMDRLSGSYKRYATVINFVIAIVVVTLSNADSIQLGRALWQDDATRTQIAASAQEMSKNLEKSNGIPAGDLKEVTNKMADLNTKLNDLNLPIGWNVDGAELGDLGKRMKNWNTNDFLAIALTKVVGLGLTILAVSLGAPFWVETMNKLVSLRTTGAKPLSLAEKEKEQAKLVTT